jgi:hypothetical protein
MKLARRPRPKTPQEPQLARKPAFAAQFRLKQRRNSPHTGLAKYTPKGGEISIAAECADENVCIRVHDNGIGIPKDRIESIFDFYTQLNESAKTAERGIGLGLTWYEIWRRWFVCRGPTRRDGARVCGYYSVEAHLLSIFLFRQPYSITATIKRRQNF